MTRNLFAALVLVHLGAASALAAESAEAILEKSRAAYASWESYSDIGSVTIDTTLPGGASTKETHSFATSFQKPRSFVFDFQKKASGERLVVWCDGAEFHSWWSATGVSETYAKGKGLNAFALASYPTRGSVVQISSLLFQGTGLQGPLLFLDKPQHKGMEELGGRKVHRIEGMVGLAYGKTGTVTAKRPTTVWIDAETLLVRKIVEDTADNAPKGSVDRMTTTFEPRANPKLDAKLFQFRVP